MEVRGSIQHAEDRRSGLRPLNGDHRASTTSPLRHGLLIPDRVQPDAAVPATHLERAQEGTTHRLDGLAPLISMYVGGAVYTQAFYRESGDRQQ